MLQIVDVVPAVIGNVFARAVAHEWQVSNSSHQNGNGHMISQNGNSTAVSNSVSSSKGRLSLELNSTIFVYVLYYIMSNCITICFFLLFSVAKDFSQYEPIFLQMSEDKKTVNAFELADLLEACLPNGMFSNIIFLDLN